MFGFMRFPARLLGSSGARASAAALSVSAAGVVSYKAAPTTFCLDKSKTAIPSMTTKLPGNQQTQEAVKHFQLFNAYQRHFGEDSRSPVTEQDLTDILLGCGILDPAIVHFMYDALRHREYARQLMKAETGKETDDLDFDEDGIPKKVSFRTYWDMCQCLCLGDLRAKSAFIFEFLDLDKNTFVDKFEVSTTMRHLLWCQTNWYGEEILYEGPADLDLYFEVPTESIAQLKANRFAHEMVTSMHGGSKSLQLSKKQFFQWMFKGGKQVETLKGLFSVFGAYDPPTFYSFEEPDE